MYHGDNVSNSITRVNDSSSKGSFFHSLRGPRCSKSEYCLDCNVKARDVKGFKHDFGSIFSVFRGIQRRFGLEDDEKFPEEKITKRK